MARHALRQRRERQGLSQEKAAFELRVSVSTYRSWETGGAMPRVGYRPRLAKLLDVSLAEVGALLDGNGDVAPNGHVVPHWLGHLASLEQGAAEIRAFEPVAIYSLLQTPDYAAGVERVGGFSDEQIAQRVEIRTNRQKVLRRQPNPLRLSVILDESTLLRPAGDVEVMALQLDHLVDAASLPNITIQVMPFVADTFRAAFGAFKLLTSPETEAPFMAVLEDSAGPHYLDRPHEVDRHASLFEDLARAALTADESVDLIRTVAKEKYQ